MINYFVVYQNNTLYRATYWLLMDFIQLNSTQPSYTNESNNIEIKMATPEIIGPPYWQKIFLEIKNCKINMFT